MASFVLFSVLLLCLSFTPVLALQEGRTLAIDGIHYFVPPVAVTKLVTNSTGLGIRYGVTSDLMPMTVMENGDEVFTDSKFQEMVGNYSVKDDVWGKGFLSAVYLKHGGSAIESTLNATLDTYDTQLFMNSKTTLSSHNIPAGPYVVNPASGEVYQVYRLYSDVQGAFTEGTIANPDGSYSVLNAAVPSAQSGTIGVPSRLYYTQTPSQPLAGVRLGVKDIFHIQGTRTSCGNRAYYSLYPPSNVTAPAVQKLVDAGAVVVGKMKTSQFANGEAATADWVDYHSPFNSRGDGYQDPSSSSAGPGAGIGAYSWLDLGLGSDTGGSIRNPSQVNGAFGNRPSHGLVSLNNVMPMSPILDTAGFITRNITLWKAASQVLYGNSTSYNWASFPSKILTSGFPTSADSEADAIVLSFLANLTQFLNASVSSWDSDAAWNATAPSEAGGVDLTDYLGEAYPALISQNQYEQLAVPFLADYAAANAGRRPFIDPSPQIRWAWGQNNISSCAADEAVHNMTIFQSWFNSTVLRPSNLSCSDSLLLYVGTDGTPTYRNVYKDAPGIPAGWDVSRISGFAQTLDHVWQIGQAGYQSSITGETEYLPVAVDVLAARGCDGMVMQLVQKLEKAGILGSVAAGMTMF